MNGSQRGPLLALVLAAVVSAGLAYGLLPFRAAGAIDCTAVLRGSDPEQRATTGFIAGQEERACRNKGSSRLFIGAITTLVLLAVGLGAVLLPESQMERVLFGEEQLPDYGR
ncbi:MAG: hypothetical protein M3N68_06940 [Actinomycetota bacterium]|nr:hypothetical protein [Actinomycetota bacterium]